MFYSPIHFIDLNRAVQHRLFKHRFSTEPIFSQSQFCFHEDYLPICQGGRNQIQISEWTSWRCSVHVLQSVLQETAAPRLKHLLALHVDSSAVTTWNKIYEETPDWDVFSCKMNLSVLSAGKMILYNGDKGYMHDLNHALVLFVLIFTVYIPGIR